MRHLDLLGKEIGIYAGCEEELFEDNSNDGTVKRAYIGSRRQ